jgi:hypothetical protein
MMEFAIFLIWLAGYGALVALAARYVGSKRGADITIKCFYIIGLGEFVRRLLPAVSPKASRGARKSRFKGGPPKW